jgi:hypothetical protein
MTKSHVSLETNICPVCGTEFETNGILLDTRLRDSLEYKTRTGYDLCPEHQRMFEEGYIHLVVAESDDRSSNLLKIEDAHYTGEIISVKRDVLSQLVNTDIDAKFPFVYIEPEAAAIIKEIAGLDQEPPTVSIEATEVE